MNRKPMKPFLYLLFFTFAFFGCEKDDTVTSENSSEQPKFTINLISKSELSENKSVKTIVETLPNSKDLISQNGNTNLQGKLIYSEKYDFYVDNEQAYHITSGDYESYTFAIKRPENNGLTENLVLSKQKDGTYKASIMSYDLTETERQSVIDGVIPVGIENKTSVQPLPEVSSSSDSGIVPIGSTGIYYDTATGGCVKIIIDLSGETIGYTWNPVNCPQYIVDNGNSGGSNSSGSAGNDNSGNNSGSDSGYDSGYDPTNGNTTGGDGSGNPNGTNTSTGSGNTNNNNTTQNPDGIGTVTKPLEIMNVDGVLWECFGYGSLAYTRAQLLDDVQRTAIANYINMNGCSEENSKFAKEVVNAMIDDGEVDFENRIIKRQSFEGSETECVHDKLMDDTMNNFYKQMLTTFSTDDFEVLNFEIGTLPNGVWGYTYGHEANTANNQSGINHSLDFYTIRINSQIENTSNLSQMVALSHEVIHAYMYNTLDNLGILSYYPNGDPKFDTTQCTIQPNVNLNSLSEKDRWIALICAYNANNPGGGENWTHALFNTANFDVNTYRAKLENLLLNNHNWDDEPLGIKILLESEFGNNQWKQKASEYMSWAGLEKTDEFTTWAQNNNLASTTNADGGIEYILYNSIQSTLKNAGTRDCLEN
ncbi:hypothetical protein [Winogradskyella pacifica]|uniref:hypothetical protein n=1 Tax=Winogradskyella pacifica TaxID=664642 RepID=UPI0015C80A6C|nr:hypothetical protein [Winogradskyella pacifica]